jgi:hypothetical protein
VPPVPVLVPAVPTLAEPALASAGAPSLSQATAQLTAPSNAHTRVRGFMPEDYAAGR